MRFLVPVLLTLPGFAMADQFQLAAPLTAVTVYPSGVQTTRSVLQNLPQGQHRIDILLPQLDALPELALAGDVTILGMEVGQNTADPEPYFSTAQRAAFVALETADDALLAAQEDRQALQDQLTATEDQIAYLRSVSAGAGDQPDAETLQSTLALLGTQLVALRQEQIALRRTLRDADDVVEDAQTARADAQREFDALGAPQMSWTRVSFDVLAGSDTDMVLQIENETGQGGWEPMYTLSLDTDAGAVALERQAMIRNFTGARWDQVALTLSTLTPGDQLDPSPVFENIARYFDQPQVRALSRQADSVALPAPVMEPAIVAESLGASAFTGVGAYDGAAFVFTFPTAQTIEANSPRVLALGSEDFQADVTTLAVPRRDSTAFVTADVVNTSGGPLLAGRTRLMRDGTFMGEGFLSEVADGDDVTLAFGAQNAVQLAYRVKDRETGDRGLLTRSNTREDVVELELRNLSDTAQDIRVLHALPVSEQEDLQIDIRTTPQISERDVDGQRGVTAWDVALAGGETKVITVTMSLTWPDGQMLDWRP